MKAVEDFPVLILGYMRFEGILRNLESCGKAGISRVYLSLDGPKDSYGLELQESALLEIRNFAKSRGIELRLRRRHSNIGLAVAVIEGVSWFFENEELGAILEDDLDISTDFLQFASQALETFQNNPKVALVSGSNFQSDPLFYQVSATHYPLIWGWATRRAVWDDFLISLDRPLISKINLSLPLSVNAFWWTAARQSRDGVVDSWAMSFSNYIRMRNLLCVLPPVNLISNKGADVYAVHSNSSDPYLNFPVNALSPDFSWSLPPSKVVSDIDRHLESFVFGISKRSLLSPLKYLLLFAFVKYFKKRKSLVNRLNSSRESVNFSISRGDV